VKAKQKILVTGGAGFIGSHLVKRLARLGFKIVVVDNLNNYYSPKLKQDRLKIFLKDCDFDFYKIDISDYRALKKIFVKYKFDVVCHLAAQAGVRYSLVNPWVYERANVLGTLNLLELLKEQKRGKLVFASSSSVYGANKKLPFSERDQVDRPISLYAATKKSNELMAYAYHQLFGLPMVGLRFFTVYGPWGRPDMACFKFADLMRRGQVIEIYNFGQMARDFTYVDDIIDGLVAAIRKDFKFEIFNLGNNRPEKLNKLVALLEKNLGRVAKKRKLPLQAGDVTETWADISKAKKQLGYQPKISLEKGLKKFTDWYKDYYQVSQAIE